MIIKIVKHFPPDWQILSPLSNTHSGLHRHSQDLCPNPVTIKRRLGPIEGLHDPVPGFPAQDITMFHLNFLF